MTAKKYINYFILSVASILTLIAIINYTVDPYWTFSHSNILNSKQIDFNERQQKTNYLYYINKDYEGLIIGSSRTTYINQEKLQGKIFNYAANGMYPYEYKYYIKTFKKITKKPPKIIILGMDFFGTDKSINHQFKKLNTLEHSKEFLYKYKLLFNYDVIKYSIKNIKQHIKISKPFYNRQNIKNIAQINNIDIQIKKGLRGLDTYQYDNQLPTYFSNLKKEYPKSKFIIYTTPVYVDQFKLYMNNNLQNNYFRWIKSLIDIFGEVHNFMIIDKHTTNKNNFFDSNHATPKFCNTIANSLNQTNSDFGVILNKNNFDTFKKSMIEKLHNEK